MAFKAAPANPELDALIERARHHKMTPQEVFEQRVSWVWGMLDKDDKRTKDDIRAALVDLQGSPV